MKNKSTVSEKGQITIPKKIRELLGIQPGTELEFQAKKGVIFIVKILPEDPLQKWRGKAELPVGNSVDSYLEALRDGES